MKISKFFHVVGDLAYLVPNLNRYCDGQRSNGFVVKKLRRDVVFVHQVYPCFRVAPGLIGEVMGFPLFSCEFPPSADTVRALESDLRGNHRVPVGSDPGRDSSAVPLPANLNDVQSHRSFHECHIAYRGPRVSLAEQGFVVPVVKRDPAVQIANGIYKTKGAVC